MLAVVHHDLAVDHDPPDVGRGGRRRRPGRGGCRWYGPSRWPRRRSRPGRPRRSGHRPSRGSRYPAELAAVTSSPEVNRPRSLAQQSLVAPPAHGSRRTCRSPRAGRSPAERAARPGPAREPVRSRRPGRARWSGRSRPWFGLSPSRVTSDPVRWVAWTAVVSGPRSPWRASSSVGECSRRTPGRLGSRPAAR